MPGEGSCYRTPEMLLCELGCSRLMGSVWWRGAGDVSPRGSTDWSLHVLGHRGSPLCSTHLWVEREALWVPVG